MLLVVVLFVVVMLVIFSREYFDPGNEADSTDDGNASRNDPGTGDATSTAYGAAYAWAGTFDPGVAASSTAAGTETGKNNYDVGSTGASGTVGSTTGNAGGNKAASTAYNVGSITG